MAASLSHVAIRHLPSAILLAAVPGLEEWVRESPNNASSHARLGLLYAYLGRKEDALREGRRAVELEPESQDAFHGAVSAANLALIHARTGDADQAIRLIERLLTTPGPAQFPDFPENITLADLRLRWEWDPLRSDPRFQKILAEPEPKTILSVAAALRRLVANCVDSLPEHLVLNRQTGFHLQGTSSKNFFVST